MIQTLILIISMQMMQPVPLQKLFMQKNWHFFLILKVYTKTKMIRITLISELHVQEAEKLISEGYVGGGMIPKLQNCIDAIEEGCKQSTYPGWTYSSQPASGNLYKQRYRYCYFERGRRENITMSMNESDESCSRTGILHTYNRFPVVFDHGRGMLSL